MTAVAPSSSVRKALVLGGFALAAVLVYVLRSVLVPLFIAFLVAYALDPIVDKLESWRIPRGAAAPLVMVGLLGALVGIGFFAVPLVVDQFGDAARELPSRLRALHEALEGWLWGRFHVHMPGTWTELLGRYGATLRESLPDATAVLEALFGTVNAILFLLGLLIIPVFSLYLLIDFDRIVVRAETLIPRRWAPEVHKLALEIHVTLGRYVRGQLLTNIILATLYGTGLALVGVRLGAAIGIITGLLAFVPYVGLAVGTTLAMTMALLDFRSATQLFAVAAVMGGVGMLDGMVITPRIVGGSVGLKPLEVLLTMMAAATLFGFLGVLLAVPLGAVLKILVGHAVDAYLRSSFYLQPKSLEAEELAAGRPPSPRWRPPLRWTPRR